MSRKSQKYLDVDQPPLPKDFQVRLFQNPIELRLIPGEVIHTLISRVEDSKAHPGQYGQIQITNIRLIWYMPHTSNINISIGYHAIQGARITEGSQVGIGRSESLFIRCRESTQLYEFVFVSPKNGESVFRFFEVAYKNYCGSPLFREQKLRSSILRDHDLILLNNEQVMLKADGISNFSGDVAKLGTAIVTNFRFIWYSEVVTNFNVTIPLILLPSIKINNSKRYGKSFYLVLFSAGSKYMYGFTMQPEEKLNEFISKFEKIRFSAVQSPVLTPPLPTVKAQPIPKPPEIQEEDISLAELDPALRYLPMDEDDKHDAGIIFDKTLGLAIEQIPQGTNLSDRWKTASETPLVDIDSL